jgi:hypothetical protein
MASEQQNVTVTDIKMPFGSMVVFMVKWAVASIPAIVILTLLTAGVWAIAVASIASLNVADALGVPARLDAARHAAAAARRNAPESEVGAQNTQQPESAYASQVAVRNVSVGTGALGDLGAFGEIKNLGDHTLQEVEITIYCLASDGKPVYEQKYYPVLKSAFSSNDSTALKPGYGRQFGVKLDKAPSDWAKKVDVKVTGVKFAD